MTDDPLPWSLVADHLDASDLERLRFAMKGDADYRAALKGLEGDLDAKSLSLRARLAPLYSSVVASSHDANRFIQAFRAMRNVVMEYGGSAHEDRVISFVHAMKPAAITPEGWTKDHTLAVEMLFPIAQFDTRSWEWYDHLTRAVLMLIHGDSASKNHPTMRAYWLFGNAFGIENAVTFLTLTLILFRDFAYDKQNLRLFLHLYKRAADRRGDAIRFWFAETNATYINPRVRGSHHELMPAMMPTGLRFPQITRAARGDYSCRRTGMGPIDAWVDERVEHFRCLADIYKRRLERAFQMMKNENAGKLAFCSLKWSNIACLARVSYANHEWIVRLFNEPSLHIRSDI
eukprot:jgi/Mesvir1/2679/Mv22858-RA.1